MENIFFTIIAVIIFAVNVTMYFRLKDVEKLCVDLSKELHGCSTYFEKASSVLEEVSETNQNLSQKFDKLANSANKNTSGFNWENISKGFIRPGQSIDGSS